MKSIFISYSHQDETFKDELITHLSGLQRNKLIKIWDDRQIEIGSKWDSEITQKLNSSQVVLFLMSSNFLASEYINEVEIKSTIERHEKGNALLVPVFIRPCDFSSSIISKFQGTPKDAKFLSTWSNRDEGYVSIVEDIKKLLSNFTPTENSKVQNNTSWELDPCDTPPDIDKWVGRNEELRLLSSSKFKVIFITGFGGQGKSSLATYYLREEEKKEDFESWDWRDFKEENNRLKTKIYQIIKRYSSENLDEIDLKEANDKELIDLLFNILGNKKVLFVFDNIDSYIDYENFVPIDGFQELVSQALTRPHNCRFLFTCRPFIKKADVGFFQIDLPGLKLESAVELLEKYNLPIKKNRKEDLFSELHRVTKGHPLWLHLLAAQAFKGVAVLEEFLDSITAHTNFDEASVSKILSDQIIDKLWISLNANQKKLLRCLSELVRAEEMDAVYKIVERELTWNKFTKSLKSLKLLNLIETKTRSDGKEELELHPLVKSFIRNKYPPSERSKFISIVIDYYNKLTFILKEKLSGNEQLSFYENWSNKVELSVNKNDFSEALIYLQEIAEPILTAGYFEEYIRIGKVVFNKIDFDKHLTNETPYFLDQLKEIVETLSSSSRFSEARKILDSFERSLKSKGKNFVILCKLNCYYFWSKHEFLMAIEWGEKAEKISIDAQLDNDNHTLNLAKRDSRIPDHIEDALSHFLKGTSLDNALKIDALNSDFSAHYFGNIGRCLYLQGRYEETLIFYSKSFVLCYKEEHSNKFQNRGFISYWIGQLFHKLNKNKEAFYFFSNSIYYWKYHNPHNYSLVKQELDLLKHELSDINELEKLDSANIELQCKQICKL